MQNKKTVKCLKNLQKKDGCFVNIYSAFYSIKTFHLIHNAHKHDPVPYIKIRLNWLLKDDYSIEINSKFNQLFRLIDLCFTLKILPQDSTKNSVIDIIFRFKNIDQGFGDPLSTLMKTSQALSILNWLDHDIRSLKPLNYLKSCENYPPITSSPLKR